MFPFINRTQELERLRRAFTHRQSRFVCVYGRRRLGKSRLLQEASKQHKAIYFVADERNATWQRTALASEIDKTIKGFARVTYPDWAALLERFQNEAPPHCVLILDEFPYLVQSASELPSVLQRVVDDRTKPVHWTICGSSQRMMMGLTLDSAAPLYGRASELIKLEAMGINEVAQAFPAFSSRRLLEAYAVWGGVPRYWELARQYKTTREAIRHLVLDPLGVLHLEPERLLHDEFRETTQAASLLALIGHGCHRISEIAARLERSATALSRPLAQLVELGFVRKQTPFGIPEKDSKRSTYDLADPFLRFWFRYIEPNRSRLAARQFSQVEESIEASWNVFLGHAWEDLARQGVATLGEWQPASRYWGKTEQGQAIELDIVAAHHKDNTRVLVGEAKLNASAKEVEHLLNQLKTRAEQCEPLKGKKIEAQLWVASATQKPKVRTLETLLHRQRSQ